LPLQITDSKAETLANELARKTGESVPNVIVHALEAHLEKLREQDAAVISLDAIMRIAERSKNLPNLDKRSADEILGYNETGLFQ